MAYYVHVLNTTMGGTVFYEGRARVIKTIDCDDKLVIFEKDKGQEPVRRYVDPGAQENPAARVAELNDTPDNAELRRTADKIS